MEPCLLNQVSVPKFEEKMTPERRAKFWAYAKDLGANTGADHNTVINQMAQDFNMPQRLVAQALDGPKSIYRASAEVKLKQRMSQKFLAENAKYLEQFDQTGTQRIFNKLDEFSRTNILRYHGPVPPVTHAIDIAATNPVEFAKTYLDSWRASSMDARDRIMNDLKNPQKSPYYQTFLDAGAPIGDEPVQGFSGTGWASRSLDAGMKPLRYRLMEREFLKAPESERTPELAKHLAKIYSHATGALVKGEPMEVATRWVRRFLLAPQLTPSKIANILDTGATLNTLARMGESKLGMSTRPPTFAERRAAQIRLTRTARYFGPILTGLALNDLLLQGSQSQQRVNFMHPSRSDWMAFKFAGHTVRMRGTMEMVALIAKLWALGSYQKEKFGAQSPEEAAAKYSEYKLTPGFGIVKEVLTGKDFFGRPSAWNVADPGGRVFPRKNWMEEVGQQLPIFVGHGISAFHEALRDQGVDTRASRNVLRTITTAQGLKAAEAALVGGVPEFFGINVQPDRYVGRPGGLQEIYKKP